MSIQQQIQALHLFDTQVRGLSSRLNAATRRRDAQANKLEQLQTQHRELEQQLKHCQTAATAAEKQLVDLDAKIDEHREQMNSVTSNKQYSALLVEVNMLKDQKAKLEEQALAEMSGVEECRKSLDELDQQIAEQKKLVENAEAEVEAARSEVGDRLDDVKKQRDEAAEQLPADVLRDFERLADAYGGEAVVEIEEQDRRRMEYTCGGCFMSLPFETVNKLLTRPDEVAHCSNCNRILYAGSELKQALAPK